MFCHTWKLNHTVLWLLKWFLESQCLRWPKQVMTGWKTIHLESVCCSSITQDSSRQISSNASLIIKGNICRFTHLDDMRSFDDSGKCPCLIFATKHWPGLSTISSSHVLAAPSLSDFSYVRKFEFSLPSTI